MSKSHPRASGRLFPTHVTGIHQWPWTQHARLMVPGHLRLPFALPAHKVHTHLVLITMIYFIYYCGIKRQNKINEILALIILYCRKTSNIYKSIMNFSCSGKMLAISGCDIRKEDKLFCAWTSDCYKPIRKRVFWNYHSGARYSQENRLNCVS